MPTFEYREEDIRANVYVSRDNLSLVERVARRKKISTNKTGWVQETIRQMLMDELEREENQEPSS